MDRLFWKNKILSLLQQRSIVWLSGVRRAGKTTLARQIAPSNYFDCELPTVRHALEDPEFFFRKVKKGIIVLDEIHRLVNPSEILKIAADHFPDVKVVATGSSTLAAKSKFRDTLTGRKHDVWLVPSIQPDLDSFKSNDLDQRMLKGGLPPFLLAPQIADSDYLEWIDSYWAKDLQELFSVEKRAAFMKCIELLFRQSGELFEAQALAGPCEVSRQTIQNYLNILETTLLVQILRPYHDGSAVEIKSQPKVFGFDTGFVSLFKGIESLRDEDRGLFLEHLVLGELNAKFSRAEIFYWRDKQKHEVDFVVKPGRSKSVLAIECKIKHSKFSAGNLKIFRKMHPGGENLVVCLDLDKIERRLVQGVEVLFIPYRHFHGYLNANSSGK